MKCNQNMMKYEDWDSFLKKYHELSALNKLVHYCPGLIAPKFPIIICIVKMARNEINSYFRHVEGVVVRKDSKANLNYDLNQFQDNDIAILMHQVVIAIELLKEHKKLIYSYYHEYVKEIGDILLLLLLLLFLAIISYFY